MKRFLISAVFSFCLISSAFTQWQVSGGIYSVYNYQPSSSSGLENVCILYGMNHVRMSYYLPDTSPARCYRYSMSAVNPEEILFQQNGNEIVFDNPEAGYGYFIEQDNKRLSYIWLIDYQSHELELRNLSIDTEMSDCNSVRLLLDQQSSSLNYYTINGRLETIDR